MVFDKSHPLLYHFIQGFTQTFDGNRVRNTFKKELTLWQTLRHPNIVQLGSLFDILRRMGRLDISTAVAYALDIARGMNYLHQRKPHAIVHRDLTPRNVLQDEARRLKVTNFGLSMIAQEKDAYRYKIQENNMHGRLRLKGPGKPTDTAQAERLVGEIHVHELELEKLNTVRRHLENGNVETNAARNRFGRSSSMLGSANYIVETPGRPYTGGRSENQQKLWLSNFEESDRDNSSKHGEV
ncbi:hypothetical protein ACLOJK_031555 [Asimina triloba]